MGDGACCILPMVRTITIGRLVCRRDGEVAVERTEIRVDQ